MMFTAEEFRAQLAAHLGDTSFTTDETRLGPARAVADQTTPTRGAMTR